MRLRLFLLIGILITAVVAAGCGGTDSSSSGGGSNEPKTEEKQETPKAEDKAAEPEGEHEGEGGEHQGAAGEVKVDIAQNAFSPAKVEVPIGSKVTWTNQDSVPHDVHADDDAFKSNNLAKGQDYVQEFHQAGDVNYHCHVHPNMKGTISVK